MNNLQLTSELMRFGISPRYKAFLFVLYLIKNFDAIDFMRMSNKEIMEIVEEEFGVEAKSVESNFKSLMRGSAYVNGKKSEVFELMGYVGKNAVPSIKEFLTSLKCLLEGRESNNENKK